MDDGEHMWFALVAAEETLTRCRYEVHQLPSRARVELLANALSGGSVKDRTAALKFLRDFPGDVPEFLEFLVDLSLSSGWAPLAWEAIWPARNDIDQSQLTGFVVGQLSDGAGEDYLMLANMLAKVEAWETLDVLIRMAFASNDLEIQEVARDFKQNYRGMLPS